MKKGEQVMDRLESQKEEKSVILEDMLSFIRYTPNREADILAFMEKYQKSDNEERPTILEHLRCCMDGKEYPNPYAYRYYYTQKDVSKVGEILDEYIDCLLSAEGNPDSISKCVRDTVLKINELNDICKGYLVDTWRRERLCTFINSAVLNAGLSQDRDFTLEYRMW
ncbi:hypothetical protein DSECCO2_467900 [anaerobic digester metagenome]